MVVLGGGAFSCERGTPVVSRGKNRSVPRAQRETFEEGGEACLLIRKHDHYTPARKMRRDVRALTARNHPEGLSSYGRARPLGPARVLPKKARRGVSANDKPEAASAEGTTGMVFEGGVHVVGFLA